MEVNCAICSASPFLLTLSCGCSNFCQDCVCSWFHEQLNGQGGSIDSSLVCPAADQRHEIPLEEVLEVTKGSSYEDTVTQLALRKALRGIDGMVFCPGRDCSYVGWVSADSKCSFPVECELCGTKWAESQLLPWWKRLLSQTVDVISGRDDVFNLLWKDMWTEACPGCGVLIEKNGGCPHMNCYRCKLDFCWICMKPYRNHDSGNCNTRLMIYTMVYFLFGLLLFLKLFWICGILETFFHSLFMLFAALGMIALGGVGVVLACEVRMCVGVVFLSIYVVSHYLLISLSSEWLEVFELEAGMCVALAHCMAGFAYLKYTY